MARFKTVALFIGNKFYKKLMGAFSADYDFRRLSIFFEPNAIKKNDREYFFQFKKTKIKYEGLPVFKLFSVVRGNPYEWDNINKNIKGLMSI